jgi:TPP-dependent pyruvate/acetoin dehydrogenase alpha subunit
MGQLNHETILKQGRYRGVSVKAVAPVLVAQLYRSMLRLRRCEEALIKEYHPADEMRCPMHFCLGQEAAPAALSVVLGPEDYLFSHHRSHGHYLAKGAPMKALFAEVYGRETGANGGKAGSQDISFSDVHFYSGAILTGAVAISVGAAYGLQQRKLPYVSVAGFGEGATDEGVFWEAINVASLRRLPVVFVCENNRYATYSPQSKRQLQDNLHERVATFGMTTKAVFGNDAIAVHAAIADAATQARSGGGPVFVETFTYRWNGHVGPEDDDHIGYRPVAELEFWKQNDPILLLEEPMRAAGLLDDAKKAAVVKEIDHEIAEAFAFAKASPFPREVDWLLANYDPTSPLADRLLQDVESAVFNHAQKDTIPAPY